MLVQRGAGRSHFAVWNLPRSNLGCGEWGWFPWSLFTPKQGSDVSTEAKQNTAQGCGVTGVRAGLALLLPRICPWAGGFAGLGMF